MWLVWVTVRALVAWLAFGALTHGQSACSRETATQKKEYSDLTEDEKFTYINAVKCLMEVPSVFPAGEVPASTSLWLDFTAVHISHVPSIHNNGAFLSWHRHYLWLFEQALHTHCGLPSTQGLPYWDFLRYPGLTDHPMLDGSPSSMGGNGAGPNRCLTGTFAGLMGNFMPIDGATDADGIPILPPQWNQPTPRCVDRDFNQGALDNYLNATNIEALLASPDIRTVQRWLDGSAFNPEAFTRAGLHAAAHMTIGGIANEIFASPLEPLFFILHGGIDWLWYKWQETHPDLRYTWNGTSTFLNPVEGYTPPVDSNTVLDFGPLGAQVTAGQVADTLAGNPLCFVYV